MIFSIREIQDSGKLLILSDGSKWEISSFDSFHTRMWMRMDTIEVQLGKLTNETRKQTVDARRKH